MKKKDFEGFIFTRISRNFHNPNLVDNDIKMRVHGTEHTWYELLQEFKTFLEGCGYVIPMGNVDVIEETADE
jgi:hypothetical protein